MATQLKNFNWDAPSHLTRTEKATYPWEQWLDGHIWKLTQGKDFHPHPLMMERIIRTRATGRQAKLRLRHQALDKSDDTNPFGIIVVQRTDITPSDNGQTTTKATTTKAPAARKAPAKTVAKTAKAPAKAKAAVKKSAPKGGRIAQPRVEVVPSKRARKTVAA